MISSVRRIRAWLTATGVVLLAVGLAHGSLASTSAEPEPPAAAGANAPDVWQHLVEHLYFPAALLPSQPQARRWARANRNHLRDVLARADPYLPHILHAVRQRGLPTELALIPAVESGFRNDVRSPAGADGLWQFMPRTAASFGVKSSWWYEGRRDVIASTEAALDYLETLNERFEGNWLITIAAYNCGERAMERALERAGVRARDADLWSILHHLPEQTQGYVPRLLAVADIVRAPERYGVALPVLRPHPRFVSVDTGGQVHIGHAANLIGMDPEVLYSLNAAFRRGVTDPNGPHRLLVPRKRAPALRAALRELPPKDRVDWVRHTVESGETLGTIAVRHRIPVADLAAANRLDDPEISAGNALLVPRSPRARTASGTASASMIYRVRAGDSLWLIARRYNTTVDRLLSLNGLSPSSVLYPGQTLLVA